ncbi:MAG: CU044_2847 family protein [Microbacteriaceae bacterium]
MPPPKLSLDTALEGLVATAEATFAKISSMEWNKATIELGVEIAVESGTLVAVIGKANGKSSLKVQLEFDRATD